MTCKDCLHYEACDRLADAKLGYDIMQVRTGVCKCFSDKAEWLHLPCKHGGQVFSIVVFGGKPTIVTDRVCGFVRIEDTIGVITNVYVDGGTWGYNVFPTQEEAEKALAERK
nr:MAG TPA: nucleoporin [Caudoviricetes sp.]